MTTIVKAADAAQFLSFLPRLLGYTPVRSLVAVPMDATLTLGAMRVDLPPGDDPASIDAVASTTIGSMCRIDAADALTLVVYTDESVADGLPCRALADAVAVKADAGGLLLRDALVVAADGWGSFLDPDCPRRGHPLSELVTTTPDGLPPMEDADQSSGARLPEATTLQRRRVAAALRSLRTVISAMLHAPVEGTHATQVDPAAFEAADALDDLPRLFEDVVRTAPDDPMTLGMLAWVLNRPALRDIALVQWASDVVGGHNAHDAQHRWESGEPYPSDLAQLMWGEGPTPDADRLRAALELCRTVAAVSPRRERPGALALCAWLSWALGRATHADAYCRMAQQIDRTHGLAHIIRRMVSAGLVPEWAFRR